MKRRAPLFFAFLCLVGMSASAVAQVQPSPQVEPAARFDEAVAIADSLLAAFQAGQRIPGLTAAVLVDGDVVWSEGYGYADLDNRVAAWPDTKMRVGSVSKSLTSVALGLLVEADLLDLDAPIQTYVPDFPEKRYPITTRQVAGHLAGIRHYRGDEFLSSKHYATVDEGLEIFEDDTLLFRPGTDYSYSSYGWNLVSAAVEGASGEDFLSFMQHRVFEPMGLHDTEADYNDSLITRRTHFYAVDDAGHLVNAPYVDNSYKWAAGGFLSTAEDLVRFGWELLDGSILKPETVDLLFTSQHLASGEPTGYGMGWFTGEDEQGRRTVGHSGGSIGGTTQLLLYPDDGVVVAMIANRGGVRYGNIHRTIARLFVDAKR